MEGHTSDDGRGDTRQTWVEKCLDDYRGIANDPTLLRKGRRSPLLEAMPWLKQAVLTATGQRSTHSRSRTTLDGVLQLGQ